MLNSLISFNRNISNYLNLYKEMSSGLFKNNITYKLLVYKLYIFKMCVKEELALNKMVDLL